MKTKKFLISISLAFLSVPMLCNAAESKQQTKVEDHNRPTTKVANPYAKPDSEKIVKPTKPFNYDKKPPSVNPPLPNLTVRKIKTYNIPGPLAVTLAKKHGYIFKGDAKCRFNGQAWMIQPDPNNGTYCKMDGFSYRNEKCRYLRKGWEIKSMTFSDSFDWMVKHYQYEPSFRVASENDTSVPKMLMLKNIRLVGPAGAKFEDAFSHCDDVGYRG